MRETKFTPRKFYPPPGEPRLPKVYEPKLRRPEKNSTPYCRLSCSTLYFLFFITFFCSSIVLEYLTLSEWSCSFLCFRGKQTQAEELMPFGVRQTESHFIYVYDLPNRFNVDLKREEDDSKSTELGFQLTEQYLHGLLERSNLFRTTDPQKASLFYVPVYAASHLVRQEGGRDYVSRDRFRHAAQETGKLVEEALGHIQSMYPFWDRSNGRDHFMIASHEFGRCSIASFVTPSVLGETFFLQFVGEGELGFTERELFGGTGGEPPPQKDKSPPSNSCFRAGTDIVIPPHIHLPHKAPNSTEEEGRTVPFLARLPSPGKDETSWEGESGLRAMFWENRPMGWHTWDPEGSLPLVDALHGAQLCLCLPASLVLPPVAVSLALAVLSGCLPVTLLPSPAGGRDAVLSLAEGRLPWGDSLDYRPFTVNIDPKNVGGAPEIIGSVWENAKKLHHMQDALAKARDYFAYDGSLQSGAGFQLIETLRRRAAELIDYNVKKEKGLLYEEYDDLSST